MEFDLNQLYWFQDNVLVLGRQMFVSGKLKNRINGMAVRSKGIYDAHSHQKERSLRLG
jgi:hypothetical protein